jgi:gluconokinase
MGDLKKPEVKPVPKDHRWILFVSGPTASGKTSVANFIAEKLNLKFVEGDDVCSLLISLQPH